MLKTLQIKFSKVALFFIFVYSRNCAMLLLIRDDRIYSDSIRIRIFFLESQIFGFRFDNF